MNKLLSRHTVWMVLFILFLMPQVGRANPIVIDPVGMGADALLFLFFDALIDLAVLAGGFALIRELSYFNLCDFPKYFMAVVIGGVFLDLIVIVVTHEQIACGLLVIMLTGYNAFLCRSFFGFSFVKVGCIGLLVGIFTNPFLWATLLPFESMSGQL
jgi:hypothetical protein